MGEVMDTIPSILNKCLFVSPDRRTWATLNALLHSLNGGGIIKALECSQDFSH